MCLKVEETKWKPTLQSSYHNVSIKAQLFYSESSQLFLKTAKIGLYTFICRYTSITNWYRYINFCLFFLLAMIKLANAKNQSWICIITLPPFLRNAGRTLRWRGLHEDFSFRRSRKFPMIKILHIIMLVSKHHHSNSLTITRVLSREWHLNLCFALTLCSMSNSHGKWIRASGKF